MAGMPMMRGGTVYDRMKKTGYMMGSNHAMGPAMEDQQSPQGGEPDADDGKAPPNLRDADGADSCGDCEHFDTAPDQGGSCKLYGGYPVTVNQVCDSFTPKGEEGDQANANGQEVEPGPQGQGF